MGASSRPWLTRITDSGLRLRGALLATGRGACETSPLREYPRRLLIVKVHGMGDSVLLRALIELLHRAHPEVEIGVMTGSATRELMTMGLPVRAHSYDQRRVSPPSVLSAWRDVREASYEAIANFEQASLAGTAFLRLIGVRTHVGFVRSDNDPKATLLSHKVEFRHSDSMWESFLRLARVLYPDLPMAAPSINLRSAPESKQWADEWWRCRVSNDRAAVAMHIGCGPGMDFRRWPVERFVDLARRLESRWPNPIIVLTGTKLERDLIRDFSNSFRGLSIDASNLGSIEKTALILRRCRLLVSNDTGVMHLGAALGTPTVGLFGPNSPVHWAPLGNAATYVHATKLRCSPCINNYLNRMPLACTNDIVGQCMSDIRIETVESAIERVLSR
jgi:lipopolysaccharide heptosyltransferase II